MQLGDLGNARTFEMADSGRLFIKVNREEFAGINGRNYWFFEPVKAAGQAV
jgi:hypothetical protein